MNSVPSSKHITDGRADADNRYAVLMNNEGTRIVGADYYRVNGGALVFYSDNYDGGDIICAIGPAAWCSVEDMA